MAHALPVDPIVLTGLLRCLLRRSIARLVGRTIERIAMGWVPHPGATRRGGRTRDVRGNERLARRGAVVVVVVCGCGLAHLRLLRCRGGFYAAHLINSIMK